MSNTGKTITISNEAYLEIKRLKEENAALLKRWAELKIWTHEPYFDIPGKEILEKMKELEGGEG